MKNKKLFIGSIAILVLIITFSIFNGGDEKKKGVTTTEALTTSIVEEVETVQKIIEPKDIDYKVIEEEDISYPACKRIAVRITVPDESDKVDVDYTLSLIANDYLVEWSKVTIWAWGYSEESEVGASMASKGTYSKSRPCN
jgi:hypothetical protein